MAQLTTKYLDLVGLGKFWLKVKEYITTENSTLNTNLTKKIDDNDAAIRAYLESLTVNGQKVTKTPAEGKGTAVAVTIKGEHITVGGSEGDYKDMTVDAAIATVDSRIDALELKVGTVVNSVEIKAKHDTTAGDTTTEWVKITDNSVSAGTGKGMDVKYEIDDTAIDSKFEALDQEITTLQANAGVVGAKVVDTNTGTDNFVKFTMDVAAMDGQNSTDVTGKEGYKKGLLTLTVDETALDAEVKSLHTADTNEAASRKADIELLAGNKYTAGADGAVGTWATEGAPKYKSITELSTRLAAIDQNVVTKIEEKDSVENYVELTVANSATEGDSAVTITINDNKLNQKITELATADTTEATARKAADALLAGANWNAETGAGWSTAPTYADITTLSAHVKTAEGKIDALSNATHFIGVSSTAITDGGKENPTIGGEVYTGMIDGDVVISGVKEFIWSNGAWVEMGDTTIENQRIEALETWVDSNVISEAEINALFTTQAPEQGE